MGSISGFLVTGGIRLYSYTALELTSAAEIGSLCTLISGSHKDDLGVQELNFDSVGVSLVVSLVTSCHQHQSGQPRGHMCTDCAQHCMPIRISGYQIQYVCWWYSFENTAEGAPKLGTLTPSCNNTLYKLHSTCRQRSSYPVEGRNRQSNWLVRRHLTIVDHDVLPLQHQTVGCCLHGNPPDVTHLSTVSVGS